MLAVISPAKSLDFSAAPTDWPHSQPDTATDAARLARTAGRLSRIKLKALMELSDDLADLNWRRFKAFAEDPAPEATKQAALAFNGDTYAGLDYGSLEPMDRDYAQDHLRILSGLYGVLRPHDTIQPYRLEMGRPLKTRRGGTLYAYWGDRIAAALDAQATAVGARHIVNLASTEYFRAVDTNALQTPVITPVFLDEKAGVPKVISFFAKRARGAMARFMVQTQAASPQDLLRFDWQGYAHTPELSEPGKPAFVRTEALAEAG